MIHADVYLGFLLLRDGCNVVEIVHRGVFVQNGSENILPEIRNPAGDGPAGTVVVPRAEPVKTGALPASASAAEGHGIKVLAVKHAVAVVIAHDDEIALARPRRCAGVAVADLTLHCIQIGNAGADFVVVQLPGERTVARSHAGVRGVGGRAFQCGLCLLSENDRGIKISNAGLIEVAEQIIPARAAVGGGDADDLVKTCGTGGAVHAVAAVDGRGKPPERTFPAGSLYICPPLVAWDNAEAATALGLYAWFATAPGMVDTWPY